MPFLNPDVIRYMVRLKDQADIVISQWATRLQPTHAVYGRDCLPVIKEMMNLHNRKIQSMIGHSALRVRVIAEMEIRQIDHDGRSMFNINTPADLEHVSIECTMLIWVLDHSVFGKICETHHPYRSSRCAWGCPAGCPSDKESEREVSPT